MYDYVFPLITGPEVPTEFTQYDGFKNSILAVKNSLSRVDMRSEKLSYNNRVDKIMRLEEAQYMLFNYAIKLREHFANTHDVDNLIMAQKLIVKLADYSTLQVDINPYGDWHIKTTLLGLSNNTISQLKFNFVNFAIFALKLRGVELPEIRKGCVLVKISGDITKMAHHTLENRELHSLTDTFMGANNTDDNPWNFGFMYAWAFSNKPGVEIIISTEGRANLYKDFMFEFGDKKDLLAESVVSKRKKAQVESAFKTFEDIFNKYPRICIGSGIITHKQIDCLAAILRRLTILNNALRNPSIFPKDHPSEYYTKGTDPDENDYVDLFDIEELAKFSFDNYTAALVAHCKRIGSFYHRQGKILQEYLQNGFRLYAGWSYSNLLSSVSENPPMAITIERYLTEEVEPDCDNVNVLGATYKLFNVRGAIYDFSQNIMLIKSKIVSSPDLGYEEYPAKIILSRAEFVDMDFYK